MRNRNSWIVLVSVGSMVGALGACDVQGHDQAVVEETAPVQPNDGDVLYIWASDQDHQAADFIAVVDFNKSSANYGHVLSTVPLPGNATNTEPHHVGLSADGNTLAVGGLLSVLTGQADSYFYD